MKHLATKLSIIMLTLLSSTINATERIQRKSEQRISNSIRTAAARYQSYHKGNHNFDQFYTPDELNIADYAGSFSKLLQHDATSSVLTPGGNQNYYTFLRAIHSESQSIFNSIIPAPENIRVWVNPQAMYAFSLEGIDSSLTKMVLCPSLSSAATAVDMLETYGNALCRDVKFGEYGTGIGSDNDGMGGSITGNVAAVLNAVVGNYTGPTIGGMVTPAVLFRGNTTGDLVGPYVSQFLLQPLYPLFPSGCAPFVAGEIGVGNLDQDILAQPQFLPIPETREFGVTWADFIAMQNGAIPKVYEISDYNQNTTRYPITGRDMGGLVHTDGPYQPYYNALNILTYWDFPRSVIFPYAEGKLTNEGEGITMGPPDAYGLIGGVCIEALKGAWAWKWRGCRRLRPEALAGLVQRVKDTGMNPYNLNPILFAPHAGIDLLELVKERNITQSDPTVNPVDGFTPAEVTTYLLAQMYPEGSPAHPSYPAGHSTVAGACTTVIKAIFQDTTLLNTKFKPVKVDPLDPRKLVELSGEGEDQMTVGSELDKLASNIGFARDFGGVHYRHDNNNGLLLGEAIAIDYLQDHARTYTEQGFNGFEFTKRDGTRIRVTANNVTVV